MFALDVILNIAGLLLWLKWRDQGQELSRRGISLIATLKKPGTAYARIWYLLALLLLLVIRSIFYWQLGAALKWTPRIWFGVIPLSFRTDYFGRMFLFSFFSFAAALGIFYFCLLLLSILNGKQSQIDPIQSLVREHLGKLDSLPTFLKFLLPWFVMLALWCLLNKPLAAMGILTASKNFLSLLEQGAVTGLGIYFAWKYLIVGILLLHVLNSYIYFGAWPFWNFIDNSARRILKLITWIPLRFGKIDFAPLVAIALVSFAAQYGSHGLVWIYQRLSG